ncbi:helix-turn-helix transcriptional regulator [Bdellovibrionales bacterium]|nr:helix-turn-helix transcriptional regulator [Bdellovibrionales bacterium]
MKIHYDMDTGITEVFFEHAENYADEASEDIMVFRAEEDDRVVGYCFDNAAETAFENNFLTSNQKLAVLLKMIRTELALTQEQMAQKLDKMGLRQYQRLESGEENTTLNTIDKKVKKNLPDTDFSCIFKTGKAS